MGNQKVIANYKRARAVYDPKGPVPRLEKVGLVRAKVDLHTQYRLYLGNEYIGLWNPAQLVRLTNGLLAQANA